MLRLVWISQNLRYTKSKFYIPSDWSGRKVAPFFMMDLLSGEEIRKMIKFAGCADTGCCPHLNI